MSQYEVVFGNEYMRPRKEIVSSSFFSGNRGYDKEYQKIIKNLKPGQSINLGGQIVKKLL